MKVVFRVDASTLMGTGHVMRSLTLAEALRERGAETQFICRAHPGNLVELLQRQAMPVTVLPAPEQTAGVNAADYAAWLGVTQAEDAEQTTEALHGERPDWLIVDHYGLDADWEQRLRPHVARLMVIDDLANRCHDCDLLLNQNYSDGGEKRYGDLVPKNCRLLLGLCYALLRPEYSAYRRTLRPRDGEVRRVLVFFGGSDPDNITGLALEALSQPELRHLKVVVVVGANNPHRTVLENLAAARPRTSIHGFRTHLADLMVEADLGIGAGGATTWERFCLGLPALVVTTANNQRPMAAELDRAGLIHLAGHKGDTGAQVIANAIEEILGLPSLDEWSVRCRAACDGLGAKRVVEAMSLDSGRREAKRVRVSPTDASGAVQIEQRRNE